MKEELLKQLKEKFKITKDELNFKSSFKELDEIFFITDFILEGGYVSLSLSRQICRRICDTYFSWLERLHSIIFPNQGNLIAMTESKYFSEEEKREISELIKKTMALISKNAPIGLTKDKRKEAEFIDESIRFWKKEFKPKLIKVTEKINKKWAS